MAGNSVPAFFNANDATRSITIPTAVDVTFVLDLSDSTDPYPQWITTAVSTMETVNRSYVNLGRFSPNRYSFVTGGGSGSNFTTLNQIERLVTIDGVVQRWATGQQILNDAVTFPSLTANEGTNTQDIGLATNLIENTDRGYRSGNARIIIAISDAQGYGTAFDTDPLFPHIYIGWHSALLTVAEGVNSGSVLLAVGRGKTGIRTDPYAIKLLTDPDKVYVFGEGSQTNRYTELAFLDPLRIPLQDPNLPYPSSFVAATAVGGTLQINLDRGLEPGKGIIWDLRVLDTFVNSPEVFGFQLAWSYYLALIGLPLIS